MKTNKDMPKIEKVNISVKFYIFQLVQISLLLSA